jgi:hypothetical protein
MNSRESAIEECDRLVKHFDERAKRNKRKFVRYTYSSVALTVGVTVISALQGIYQPVPFWGVGSASGQRLGCILHNHGTRYKCAGIMAASPVYDAPSKHRTVSFSTRCSHLFGAGGDRLGEAVFKPPDGYLGRWA